MTKIIRVELLFLFMLFLISKWCIVCENKHGFDWSIYQKLQTIQLGLIQNNNLNKYTNLSKYSINDNQMFINDKTKIKRSYHTSQCIADLKTIRKVSYDKSNTWAFEMLGSWGKPSSVGIHRDYGNYDRCHDVKIDKSINIETQYCLVDIDVRKSNVRKITSELSVMGICIPNSCAPSLIAIILNDYADTDKSIQITIKANNCRFKGDNTTVFLSYKIFIVFLAFVFVLVILSSIYDIICTEREEPKNPVLIAFSAYTNGKNLFACKISKSPNMISCLDGIRAIFSIWVVSSHFLDPGRTKLTNPNHFAPLVQHLVWISKAGRFCVDTFFVLSAILAANKMFHELSKNGRLNIPLLYLQRILRLSPIVIFFTLFNRYLLQFCANGPEYKQRIDTFRNICEYSPWKSLLYYSNFSMVQCVRGSWYLSIDMQLYLLTPFMVLLLHHYPKIFLCFSSAIILVDSILAWFRVELGFTVKDIYFSTRSRITPWLVGVIFAYILLKWRSKKINRLPKYLNIVLLTASVIVCLMLIHGSAFVDRSFDFIHRARFLWSISVCYIIFACLNGQSGIINWFLSNPRWQPISRLSFIIFLTHQTVMAVIYANRKVPLYLSAFTWMQELFLVVSITCAVAAILALAIEMPITNLSRIYLNEKKNAVNLK